MTKRGEIRVLDERRRLRVDHVHPVVLVRGNAEGMVPRWRHRFVTANSLRPASKMPWVHGAYQGSERPGRRQGDLRSEFRTGNADWSTSSALGSAYENFRPRSVLVIVLQVI